MLSESLSLQGTMQSLHVHSIFNAYTNQDEHFITGLSAHERSLIVFEYTQLNEPTIEASDRIVAC